MSEPTPEASTINASDYRVAIVTGAARRIGAEIAKKLHKSGYNVVIHYRHSSHDAVELVSALNALRPDSALGCRAELADDVQAASVVEAAIHHWGRLDLLVNNASEFTPTPIGEIRSADLERLFSSNLHGPLFVAQAAADSLRNHRGCIINITDIYAAIPHPHHTVYCASKAALSMMTQSLARELAPEVRVNAVAPGAILWPEEMQLTADREAILAKIPLQRRGDPADIANAVRFLASDNAGYITGQTLCVDGGRSL